jgi:DEAD/DEAH box helicase domain-containing protein
MPPPVRTPEAGLHGDACAPAHLLAVDSRPTVAALLEELAADGRLVHVEHRLPREARTASLAVPLPAVVAERLTHPLWSHQADAIDLARAGRHVVVATGTASGKSLCYQLPIAEAAADRIRPGSALVLSPTKALGQDQLRALDAYRFPRLTAVTYDGDSSNDERTLARTKADVVFTNPEMVHAGLLPNHARWATFLGRLRFVVVDELHMLRGVFGTHVAHLLRRLRRVAALYGREPTFIFCSATIGEPSRLASELCGQPVVTVDDDGSPQGHRSIVLVNPPVFDDDTGSRTATNVETAIVAARLVRLGQRTIVFCRSRKATENVAADIRRRLPPTLADTVRSYRAGYLATERREIEAELADGEVRAVVATSALELGVDIAGIDACVLSGFPGTIASFWQQAGRAGRSARDSTTVLVAGDDQLDQWLMAHPHELFRRRPEPAVINVANPFVLHPQLACAAFEHPLTHADGRYWPDALDDAVRDLVVADRLRLRTRRGRRGVPEPLAVWSGRGVPAPKVGLRGAGAGEVRIVHAGGAAVGSVDVARAPASVHPGAVYLHQGRAYRVIELDLDGRRAVVEDDDGDTYTQVRSDTSIRVLRSSRRRTVGRSTLELGEVEVTTRVVGYQTREWRSRQLLASHALDLAPSVLTTRAFWYTLPAEETLAAGIDPEALPGTLHAAEHAAIGMLPLFTICDRWDVGGVSTAHHVDTGAPTVFIHDAHPGGAGMAELGFDAADRHLHATLEVVAACSCRSGCPSCVQSPKCGNGNEPLDKGGAVALLRHVLG